MEEYHLDRSEEIRKITRHITRHVSTNQNEFLLKPVEFQEVEEVVSQMSDGKALGPYGFKTNFFHYFWDLIKEEVWKIVEESRKNKGVLRAFNSTFLTLIPKEDGDDSPVKFIPIALCNVIYKIITKVVANRLNPILSDLIANEQS